MKCKNCGQENKYEAIFCLRCGSRISRPLITWKWHFRTIIVIYLVLVIFLFIIKEIVRRFG